MLKKLSSSALVAVFACGAFAPMMSGSAMAATEGDEGATSELAAVTEAESEEYAPPFDEGTSEGAEEAADESDAAEESDEVELEDQEDPVEFVQSGEEAAVAEFDMPSRSEVRVAPDEVQTVTACEIPPATYKGSLKASGEIRLGGATRYETSAAIAKTIGSVAKGEGRAVFIASGAGFADGLSLGALASLTGWPLLLSAKGALSPDVENYIRDLKPTHVYIAGGDTAISSAVEEQIKSLSTETVTVKRFAGASRYETSQLIASCFPKGGKAFVVTGENFPDAVAAGGVAAKDNGAIILTPTNRLNSNSRKALADMAPYATYLIGGKWDVNQITKSAGLAAGSAVYLAGADRFATSAAVAKYFYGNTPSTAVFATGSSFPDALSGISVAKMAGAPIILAKASCRPKPIVSIVSKVKRPILLGSTSALSKNSYTKTCVDPPKPKPKPVPKPSIVDIAHKMKGVPYRSGGASPQTGFDCSGLTSYVYAQVGKHIPRTSGAQWAAGMKVSNPQPGDIVVMYGGGHVGIYIGNGQMIHAATPGTTVNVSPLWSVNAFVRF